MWRPARAAGDQQASHGSCGGGGRWRWRQLLQWTVHGSSVQPKAGGVQQSREHAARRELWRPLGSLLSQLSVIQHTRNKGIQPERSGETGVDVQRDRAVARLLALPAAKQRLRRRRLQRASAGAHSSLLRRAVARQRRLQVCCLHHRRLQHHHGLCSHRHRQGPARGGRGRAGSWRESGGWPGANACAACSM